MYSHPHPPPRLQVDPVEIAKRGVEEGRRLGVDAVIVDTAGRLQVGCKRRTESRDPVEESHPVDTYQLVLTRRT